VSLVSSLLTAIVRADGDVLVLHVGERPYVVGPMGRSELASRALTLDAMKGMVAEILPAEARRLLEELGAVQHDLPASMLPTGQRFTVVAARGGDDIWVEIKRHALSRTVGDPTTRARAEAPRRTVELIEQSEPAGENVQRPAVVLPLARNQVRAEAPARVTQTLQSAGIDRLLRIAAARGASTLYLTSQARPSIRVDGEISAIEGEAILGEADVESLILDILPERNREALRSQAGTEWICDVPDVGRIRCVTFRDHRGAGGIFRMIPARAISAEQLGLSREIQGLCAEAEGLVLVAGPRSSGKSTLISAFVDLINRTRSDHVITIENQIKFVHENRGSLVSQREVRGDRSELLSVARAALRENPDVLVFEDFGSPEIVALALEAAQSGHLVIAALTAHTATAAVDRLIDQAPPETRPKVQLALAENLRGIVVQVLLRKSGGGRVAAREVLLNTSAVANLIAEGKTSQLPMAIDSGRKHGMVALNDALVAFVQSGAVDSREAYRQAADQQGFLAQLKRQGIDTSFVERLA
jgi:twitching motility protein PilT